MKDQYVSFDVAKLLSEHGFDEPCKTSYSKLDKKLEETAISDWGKVNQYKAPTQSLAMRWLREEYNLFIEIQCYGCEADEKAHFEFSYVISEYVQIDNKICTTVGLEEKKAKSQFKSYEEACEAAIKYCLENIL